MPDRTVGKVVYVLVVFLLACLLNTVVLGFNWQNVIGVAITAPVVCWATDRWRHSR